VAAQAAPVTVVAQKLEPGIYSHPEQRSGGGALPQQEDNQVLPLPLPSNVYLPAEVQALESMPNPCPPQVLFAGLRDPRLRMLQAIPLDVTKEESHVVVSWSAVEEFGAGESLGAALDDFGASIRELYFQLQARHGSLGPDLAKVKAHLGQYIAKR
jgi:hypothetical protein